jgi:hypothetical protein
VERPGGAGSERLVNDVPTAEPERFLLRVRTLVCILARSLCTYSRPDAKGLARVAPAARALVIGCDSLVSRTMATVASSSAAAPLRCTAGSRPGDSLLVNVTLPGAGLRGPGCRRS